MTGNDFVAFFLGDTMLITVTGRKTGRKYSTPAGFYREGDCLWVLTSRDRTWWRNVRNGATVSLLLHGKNLDATAQAELKEDAVTALLQEYITRVPMAARSLGILMENKKTNPEDLVRVARDKLFVRVKLSR